MWLKNALGQWPFLVWLAVALVVAWLYLGSVRYGNVSGVVETVEQFAAPMDTALLVSLDVTLGETVKQGQTVARMDTSLLDATIALEEADILDAQQTIERSQENVHTLMQRFETAVSEAEAELAATRLDMEQDAAELVELKEEHVRRRALFEKRLIPQEDLTLLQPRIAALEEALKVYPDLLAVYRSRLKEARSNLKKLRSSLELEEGEDFAAAMEARRRARQDILAAARRAREVQRAAYELKAGTDGEVSEVLHRPGEVVPAGDPVLRIVQSRSDRIVGFLPEELLAAVDVGETVLVWREHGSPGPEYRAVVESISPDIQGLPRRISPIRGQSLRGRRVMIRLQEEHDLVPGESVQVQIGHSLWDEIGNIVDGLISGRTQEDRTASG